MLGVYHSHFIPISARETIEAVKSPIGNIHAPRFRTEVGETIERRGALHFHKINRNMKIAPGDHAVQPMKSDRKNPAHFLLFRLTFPFKLTKIKYGGCTRYI